MRAGILLTRQAAINSPVTSSRGWFFLKSNRGSEQLAGFNFHLLPHPVVSRFGLPVRLGVIGD